MRTSEVLYKAADLIEKRGWTTGTWGHGSGPLCLEGGILAAGGFAGINDNGLNLDEFWACPSYVAVMDYLGRDRAPSDDVEDGPADQLWQWNDEKGRTAAEVIEVLRATAVIEEARESAAAEVSA